jgi:hypothetical protein
MILDFSLFRQMAITAIGGQRFHYLFNIPLFGNGFNDIYQVGKRPKPIGKARIPVS